jgi:hypothetical protein
MYERSRPVLDRGDVRGERTAHHSTHASFDPCRNERGITLREQEKAGHERAVVDVQKLKGHENPPNA